MELKVVAHLVYSLFVDSVKDFQMIISNDNRYRVFLFFMVFSGDALKFYVCICNKPIFISIVSLYNIGFQHLMCYIATEQGLKWGISWSNV